MVQKGYMLHTIDFTEIHQTKEFVFGDNRRVSLPGSREIFSDLRFQTIESQAGSIKWLTLVF